MPSNAILISEQILEDTADAIRAKKGTSGAIRPANFPSEILSIPTGVSVSGTINITTNGTTDVANYEYANVAVPASAVDSGTISISANGTHDVTGYASAEVNVAGGSSTKYGMSIDYLWGDVDQNGVLQTPSDNIQTLTISGFKAFGTNVFVMNSLFSGSQIGLHDVVFASLESAGDDALRGCFANTSITSLSFPELLTAGVSSLQEICSGASNLTSVSLPKLVTVGQGSFYGAFSGTGLTSVSIPSVVTAFKGTFQNCFTNCQNLLSVSFPSLKYIDGEQAFGGCFNGSRNLTSVSFPVLERIGSSTMTSAFTRVFDMAFRNCNSLESVTFPELVEIWCNGNYNSYGIFCNCDSVIKFYFPKVTTISKTESFGNVTAVNNLFRNCSSLTEIHFGAANQASIEASTGYATKWGAPSSCTIYFDL